VSDPTTRWAAEVRDLLRALNSRLTQTPPDVIVTLDFDSVEVASIESGPKYIPQIELDLLQRIPADKGMLQ
jgi:hypothetical protein